MKNWQGKSRRLKMADNAIQIIDSFEKMKQDYQIPIKIVVRRDFLEEIVKKIPIVKDDDPNKGAINAIAGIPLFITDDPLAPSYWIDYEQKEIDWKFLNRNYQMYWKEPPIITITGS